MKGGKKVKKIVISICILTVYIIFSYNVSNARTNKLPSFENLVRALGNDIIEKLEETGNDDYQTIQISGTTYAAQGYNAKYELDKEGFMNDGTRAYCISAGEGMYADKNDQFELCQCVIIGPKGIYLSANGNAGASFDVGKL